MFKSALLISVAILHLVLFADVSFAAGPVFDSEFQEGYVSKTVLSPDNETLAYILITSSGKKDHYSLKLLNLSTKQETRIDLPFGRPDFFQFTADSKWLVFSAHDYINNFKYLDFHFVETKTQSIHHSLNIKMDRHFDADLIDISADSKRLVIATYYTILVYDVATGTEIYRHDLSGKSVDVKFFNRSHKVSVVEYVFENGKGRYTNHHVIDPNTGTISNSCVPTNCFSLFQTTYAISSDDRFMIFTAIEGGNQKLKSLNLVTKKISTLYAYRKPAGEDLYKRIDFEYFPNENILAFWVHEWIDKKGTVSFFTRISPNFEEEIQSPDFQVNISNPGYVSFLPSIRSFMRIDDNASLCDKNSGCQAKLKLPGSRAPIDFANNAPIIAIAKDRSLGSGKTLVYNLADGIKFYESDDIWTTSESGTFSPDNKLLILNTFKNSGDDPRNNRTRIQVLPL